MGLCDAVDVDDVGGLGRNHSLLQLAANPISSLCCALVAVRSTAHASTDSDSDQDHSSATSKAGSGSDVDPGPPGLAGTERTRGTAFVYHICGSRI